VPAPRGRLWAAAADRGVPLATIITSVGVVGAAFLAGKLIYRLRDVLLMLTIAGFIALILNPLVVYVLYALGHSLTAGIVTAVVFIAYQQIENHVLNPVVMSRTVSVNPLLVLVSVLVGTSIGSWLGGFFGSFVAALISIPAAGALQVVARELWQATAQERSPQGEPATRTG
jgi:predicted PurR-regulated permease PerM